MKAALEIARVCALKAAASAGKTSGLSPGDSGMDACVLRRRRMLVGEVEAYAASFARSATNALSQQQDTSGFTESQQPHYEMDMPTPILNSLTYIQRLISPQLPCHGPNEAHEGYRTSILTVNEARILPISQKSCLPHPISAKPTYPTSFRTLYAHH